MDDLPIELLDLVISHVDRHALLAFSLVSKRCRSVARSRLFDTVTLVFTSPTSLDDSIHKAIRFVELTASHKYVRHLRVVAGNVLFMDDSLDPEYHSLFLRPPSHWDYTFLDEVRSELLKSEGQWLSLCELIQSFSKLTDLTWACEEQIPLCILRHIRTLTPRCRLHMRCFRLKSLVQYSSGPVEISAHDLEVATSPCLYSLSQRRDIDNPFDYNGQAILEMASGGASNLKEVFLLLYSFDDINQLPPSFGHRAFHPAAIGGPIRPTGSIGRLESLSLFQEGTRRTLESLSQGNDFTALRSLELYESGIQETFGWFVKDSVLPCLEQLTIGLQTTPVDPSTFTRLPALQSLYLYNNYEVQELGEIIKRIACRLRVLHCKQNFVQPELMVVLSQHCPYLEELGVNVFRDAGSIVELTSYHSLGQLPALRKAVLQMGSHHGASDYPEEALSDILDELYHILVDVAMDEPLVRSIFSAIASARSSDAPPFESLHLFVDYPSTYTWTSSMAVRFVARSWRCRRSLHGNDIYGCIAEEYDAHEVAQRDKIVGNGWLVKMMQSKYAPAVHRAWPKSRDIALEEAWHGFPLQTEVTGRIAIPTGSHSQLAT